MSYKDIKVKGSTGRYTDEFKEAVKDLIREGKNYKEIADLFGIDSINSGYRQLIWKLQRDVHHSVEVKQLKAIIQIQKIHLKYLRMLLQRSQMRLSYLQQVEVCL